jgi:hypothetical protein
VKCKKQRYSLDEDQAGGLLNQDCLAGGHYYHGYGNPKGPHVTGRLTPSVRSGCEICGLYCTRLAMEHFITILGEPDRITMRLLF